MCALWAIPVSVSIKVVKAPAGTKALLEKAANAIKAGREISEELALPTHVHIANESDSWHYSP
jgi:hypothetical protein